jgi:hypothetical protein
MAFRRLHHVIQHLRSTATAAFATNRRTRRPHPAAAALGLPPGAGAYQVELLETRTLLTTISGFTNDVFEYRDEHDQIIRVKATGNIVAELVGARVDRLDNGLRLFNLPGELNGTDVFGGIAPPPGFDEIGGIFINGFPQLGVTEALAAADDGTVYAINTIVTATETIHRVLELNVPLPPILGVREGDVFADILLSEIIVPFNSLAANQPRTITGADVLPDGRIAFVGEAANGSLGAWAVNPNAPDVGASLGFFGTLGIPRGDADDPAPSVESIIATSNSTLIGVVSNAGGNVDSQLVFINLNNTGAVGGPVPIGIRAGTTFTPIGNIVGIELNRRTGDLLAIQGGIDNARIFEVFAEGFQIGEAFDLGPGSSNFTSLTFVPGLTDPFTGSTLGSYMAVNGGDLVYVNAEDRLPAQFLWNVYVSQSDLTGQISIGYVREFDEVPPNPYVIRAFQGSVGAMRVRDAQTGNLVLVQPDDNTGNVLVGAHSQNINPNTDQEELIPYDNSVLPTDIDFGVLPDEITSLRPGLIVAPGQDLGKFLLGGTLMGAVDAGGSIDLFYAGWLLTGTPSGQSEGAIERPDNFNVAGDLRNLLVLDSIGSDGGATAASGAAIGEPQYVTGFDLRVGGTLGEVAAGGGALADAADDPGDVVTGLSAIVGSVEVNHLPNAPRIQRNQFEAEYHATGTLTLEDGFENFNFVGAGANARFTFNDTYNSAEYLGTIASEALGRSEVVRLSGSLQQSPLFNDPADYYAVSLMAGQRYTARVQGVPAGLLNLGVFDPDGRLMATDYNNTDLTLTQEEFFSFVPDRPGIYRFAIAATGDAPEFGGFVSTGLDVGYTLTLLGIGDIALGGVVADGAILDVFDPLNYDPGIEVFVGDLGAVKSYGGRFLSDNPDTLVVERGNLRTVDATNVGLGTTQGPVTTISSSPTLDVPQGNVGLVRAGSFVVPFDQDPLARLEDEQEILPTSTLFFNRGNTRPIGGEFQVIDGDEANVLVDLIADRGIGVIRAASMSAGASVLTVNADDSGEDGIIDLIDCFGDLGNIATGGPQITTNTGGNVRYMRVLGTMYKDVFFGFGEPDQIQVGPGEVTTVVDDSGSVLRLRAIGDVRNNTAFDPQFPQSGIDPFIGPPMLITTYGIRDAGGSALIDVTSEGGLDIEVSNGRSAEIGRIEIRGVGVEVLNGGDIQDADSPLGTRENFVAIEGTIVPTPDQQTDDPDGDEDFDAFDRRVRPEDLSIFIRGNATVDVLNVVVIDTGTDVDADEDPTADTLDEDDDGNTTELLDEDGDGFPDAPGNDNEIREADGFYIGDLVPINLLGELLSFGNAVNIINDTPRGEIVNLLAESVVNLQANGSIGMGRNHTGADIVGNEILHQATGLRGIPGAGRRTREVQTSNARDVGSFGYYLGETNAIMALGGNIGTIRAGEAIGNIAVQGSIGDIVANADGKDVPGVYEGVNGVVSTYGFDDIDQPVETGRIFRVDIGEGILPSGTGNFAEAGVFAYNSIGRVTGNKADIRGDIQVLNKIIVINLQMVENPRLQVVGDGGADGEVTLINRPRGIETVRITDGSIINSDIIITTNREDTEEFDAGFAIPGLTDPINNPIFEIGSITTNGNGGIIGSNFQASDIGRVAAGGGTFGILQTLIGGLADDRVGTVEAGGYGLRGNFIDPSGSLGNLIANGDGTSLSTNAISSSVRLSEQAIFDPLIGPIDPFFGTLPNRLTDIHAFLGTNKDQPEISGVTDTGIIEAVTAIGGRDLGNVRAWQIRGGTNLDFANSIGNLEVRDIINGLEITTGTLKNFRLNRDAFALGINVSGRVRKIDIRGSLAGGSVIRTKGDGGSFDSVNVAGNLIGNINSSRAIKTINIGGDFTGNVSVQQSGKGLGIKSMKVGGSFIAGSLDVIGGIGTITTAGSLGALGDTLTVNGTIKKITVGGDLRSNVRVNGDLKSLFVRGSIVDGGLPNGLLIDISGALNSLVVGGDIQSGVTINASRIGRQKIGGQNAGTVVIQ